MRKSFRNRPSARRRSTNRRDFLRLERLEDRLALAAAPVAINDFYHDLVNQPLEIAAPGLLANDTSSSGTPLAAGLFSGPAHGTLELAEDGSFQYVPETDFTGLDSFLYFASDGAEDSMLAAVTISVGTGGPPPDAVDDSFTVDEDGLLVVALSDGVLANDVAAEGETLSASLVAGPTNGTLTLGPDGSMSYVPNANYSGSDSFTYAATDSAGDSDIATATIAVNPVNDKPAATNDAYAMSEDGTLAVDAAGGLLTNDADSDGDALAPTITSQPLHGTVAVNPDGSFTYTPEANYNGLDGFSYLVSDGTATSDVASATITISPANDLPVGANDEYTTPEDTPLEIVAPGVLANDTDVDGDALSSLLVNPPEHGTVTLGADGALLYTPAPNFTGVDGFSYEASDGSADSDATAVTIHVTPVADAPVAAADSFAAEEDVLLTIAAPGVLANDTDGDGDALTVALVTGAASGALTLNADGSFSYLAGANFHGSDSFVYQASDGALTSEPTTVTIDVASINDAPAAADDAYSLDEGTTLTVAAAAGVLINDGDLDGDALTASVASGPTNGSVTLNADGSFDYTPNASFSGTDSFIYAASDGALTAQATVTLTVNPVAHAPVATVDNYSTGEDVPLVIGAALGVLANDVNIDGDSMSAEVVTGPSHGTLTLNPDGGFSFTPEANFHGADSFTYKAISSGLETVASANIVIEPLNDAPQAAADEFTIDLASGEPLPVLNVLANDSDIDGDALVAALVSGPAHGTLTLDADGTVHYSPEVGFEGDDAFSYQLFDGMANSNVATVTLHVEDNTAETPPPGDPLPPDENERPVAANESYSMTGDTTLEVPLAAGLLANDSDPEGAPLTAQLFSEPLHGTVTLAADGSFSYTPESGFAGADAFLYRVSDGELWSALAAVTIYVTQPSTPDEAPTPAPQPEPDPEPQPCPPPVCCHMDGDGESPGEAADGEHGGHHHGLFAHAVDALLGHHRGWFS